MGTVCIFLVWWLPSAAGRLFAVCGDGEFVIYTAQVLQLHELLLEILGDPISTPCSLRGPNFPLNLLVVTEVGRIEGAGCVDMLESYCRF